MNEQLKDPDIAQTVEAILRKAEHFSVKQKRHIENVEFVFLTLINELTRASEKIETRVDYLMNLDCPDAHPGEQAMIVGQIEGLKFAVEALGVLARNVMGTINRAQEKEVNDGKEAPPTPHL